MRSELTKNFWLEDSDPRRRRLQINKSVFRPSSARRVEPIRFGNPFWDTDGPTSDRRPRTPQSQSRQLKATNQHTLRRRADCGFAYQHPNTDFGPLRTKGVTRLML